MKLRWFRLSLFVEREKDPWTWTFHVRALTEANARRLIAERLSGEAHTVYACEPSEPLSKVAPKEEIVADYGPYHRSWEDPMMAPLRAPLPPEPPDVPTPGGGRGGRTR